MQSECASPTIFGKHLANGLRLQTIDDQSRSDHSRLSAGDECFYLYEYTSRKDFSFSATNNLISNLKKKPNAGGQQYKASAIGDVTRAFAAVINAAWLNGGTLVPVPPSKAKGHADYDDRMLKVCRQIRAAPALDVRELVVQRNSLPTAHESQYRPTVEELLQQYQIDESGSSHDFACCLRATSSARSK